jgi:O-antigen/teichoic acid export membrane protein
MEVEPSFGDVDLNTIKARSLKGVITLISRTFVLQIVSTVGFLLLSIFLGRPDIGLFIAVNDLVSILGYFSDVGLAASLIQKKDKVSLTDLRTTFTIQQALVITLLLIMLAVSGRIAGYYNISGHGLWLFYSLLLAFFLASLKSIPSVILERQLRFDILATIEITETIVFYLTAVFLAWKGFGVLSYAIAVALRGIIGTSMMYLLSPWEIGLGFSWVSLKTLLSFGLLYQINTSIAVVKDRLLNIVLWKIIGADGIGIVGWAQTWSQKPLRFVMDNVTKVTFPAFSRLQQDSDSLKSGIEKTLFFITFITFPVVGLMATLSPVLVRLIPRYQKWEIALIPLAFYCFNSALAAVSTPLTNTLNALGKVRINTYLMIMWTALTWILVPYLAYKFGVLGMAYATGIISLTSFIPVLIVRRFVNFNIGKSIGINAFTGGICVLISLFLSRLLPASFIGLTANALISGSVYLGLTYAFVGESLIADSRKMLYAFRRH